MKLIWSTEASVTGPIYVCRAPRKNNAMFIHVGVRHWSSKDKGKKREWVATILEPGMPSAGPYSSAKAAGSWAEGWVKKNLFNDAKFSPWPEKG